MMPAAFLTVALLQCTEWLLNRGRIMGHPGCRNVPYSGGINISKAPCGTSIVVHMYQESRDTPKGHSGVCVKLGIEPAYGRFQMERDNHYCCSARSKNARFWD